MKQDIILAGVGGQGILSIATIIGSAALEQGLHLKQAEVHGMSQRGGDVQSNLRLSSEPIHSDLIPRGGADVVVSLEPMEALRYLPWLSGEGWIITNTTPYVNIPNYPDMEKVNAEFARLPHVIALDVDAIAKDLGNARGANMVLLGAMAAVLQILDPEALREGIRRVFARKGEAVVEANIKAFDAGLAFSKNRR
ncbi:MAG: indolepyruvate oxidoreductase subunit beta [Bacteroidales bacterium]|nr:indolepyruvate oxidoreductase subunit beta [Bacteroidales bacterium]